MQAIDSILLLAIGWSIGVLISLIALIFIFNKLMPNQENKTNKKHLMPEAKNPNIPSKRPKPPLPPPKRK